MATPPTATAQAIAKQPERMTSVAINKILFGKDKVVSDAEATALRALIEWIKETKTSIDGQLNNASDGSQKLAQFTEFIAAAHPMSSEVAQNIQQLTSTLSTVIIQSNYKTATIRTLVELLEQVPLQSMLEYFIDRDPVMGSSVKAFATGIGCLYADQTSEEDQEVPDEEMANANDVENRTSDNNRPLNVIPIKLEQQEMKKGNPSPSAFAPDMFYQFESTSTDTRQSSNLPTMSTMLNPTSMEGDDTGSNDTSARSPEPENIDLPSRPPQPESNGPLGRPTEPVTKLVEKPKQTTQPATVTSPKYKRKPTPDRYQFGIIRYWKDAPP